MKLSEILGRILTDVALRKQHPALGICFLVYELSPNDCAIEKQFEDARQACTQTKTRVYPVAAPAADPDPVGTGSHRAFYAAERTSSMWRGEYGRNRRKLVRDCWRWAKERGL